MKSFLLTALILTSTFALAEVKPVGTVLDTLCGQVDKGSVGTEIVAVKEVCYATVVGLKSIHPMLVVKLNDGSSPSVYQVVYTLKAQSKKDKSLIGMQLNKQGSVVNGKLKSDANTSIQRGSAVEVKDAKTKVVLEIRNGSLPGSLKFEIKQFSGIYHTERL